MSLLDYIPQVFETRLSFAAHEILVCCFNAGEGSKGGSSGVDEGASVINQVLSRGRGT